MTCYDGSGPINLNCSDVARFVNLSGQAHIFFFTEESTSSGIPAHQGTLDQVRNEFLPAGGTDDVGLALTVRQLDVPGANPFRLRIQSDLPTPGDIFLPYY